MFVRIMDNDAKIYARCCFNIYYKYILSKLTIIFIIL